MLVWFKKTVLSKYLSFLMANWTSVLFLLFSATFKWVKWAKNPQVKRIRVKGSGKIINLNTISITLKLPKVNLPLCWKFDYHSKSRDRGKKTEFLNMFLLKGKGPFHFLNIEIYALLKHVVFKVWNYISVIFFMSKLWCIHIIIIGLFIRWLLDICLLKHIAQSNCVHDSTTGKPKSKPNMYKWEQVSILPFNRTDKRKKNLRKKQLLFLNITFLPDFYNRMKKWEFCLKFSCLAIFF